MKKRSHRIRTPGRHTAKHGVVALSPTEAVRRAAALLGRAYDVRSWSGRPEVNHASGLIGFYVTGTRSDGRLRTVFVPYGESTGQ